VLGWKKPFVLTGALKSYEQAGSREPNRGPWGAKPATQCKQKDLDFVVVGEDPGSKYDKALQLGH
jgi:DNA ligase (NAD+)